MKKEQSKEKAQKHTEAMERLYSKEIKKSIEETRVYKTDFFRNETAGKGAGFLLEQSYTQDSVMKNAGEEKLAVLNFASYRHAGGGFLNGSMAQEETICCLLHNRITQWGMRQNNCAIVF